MISLHPNILEKNGKKEFVILSFEEFEKIEKALQDYEDLQDLRKAKALEQDAVSYSLEETKKQLELV